MSRTVEERLTSVLGAWAAVSVVAGTVLTAAPRTRGFGRQTLTWGLIDGAIAYAGAARRAAKGPTDPQRLRRVLQVNVALDVGYLAAAGWLLKDGRWRGDGAAVAVQGGFLLALDATAAHNLR